MLLDELYKYKNELMKIICNNKKIVSLILDEQNPKVPSHTLAYKNVFPFEFVPDTVDVGKTFICFDVDVPEVRNKTYLVPVLYIWIFTHKSKLRLSEGGVRLDAIASEIDKELNGSRQFVLGTLNLRRVDRFCPIDDYQGKCLTFVGTEFNNIGPSKKAPANRRFLNG